MNFISPGLLHTVRALIVGGACFGLPAVAEAACPELLKHEFPTLSGKPRALCDFEGKVILVVNTASRCGFTPQYEGLEALHRRYQARGLVILGFPSNDFGGQEPGSDKDIADFCQVNFGVSFPMFAKSRVAGKDANPFYRQLASRSDSTPRWNFHKYLIDRSGNQVEAFTSLTRPDDKALLARLETLLNASPPLPTEKTR